MIGRFTAAVDGANLIQPVLRIPLRVPHPDQVDAARWRQQEQSVDAGRLRVLGALDAACGGQIEHAAEDRHLAAGFLDSDFRHPPLFLPRQVVDLARFGIRDDPACLAKPLLEKVADQLAIRRFIDVSVFVERQNRGRIISPRQVGGAHALPLL